MPIEEINVNKKPRVILFLIALALILSALANFSAASADAALRGIFASTGFIPVPPAPPTAVDLSTYIRVGRFDLPEPTRTAPPPNSLLAQEASAVTYNWDTDTLFVIADNGRSVVQVS